MKRACSLLAILCTVYFGIYFWLRRSPDIPSSANSAQVIFLASDLSTRQVDITVSDPSMLTPLIELLDKAEPTGSHKCTSVGAVIFDGEEPFTIGLLPGHNPNFYEFRFDGRAFKIPRQDFIKILENIGIDQTNVPLNCGSR